ncbi:MAG TPA: thiamine-binding protein [Phnomibacter sp.]|nr:thiamine-binding protein [Phnomibacter sp.]
MHSFITNASIQLVPIVQDRHPYEWIDEVIPLIGKSGLKYSVGPFGTAVEGTYRQVSALIDTINEYLNHRQCPEWLLNIQWQMRADGDVTMEEKVGNT